MAVPSFANVPGGGTGTGPNVTVTDNGGTVVLANGIVSITIDKANGNITNYTFNGTNLLSGGHGGGYFYWDGSGGPTLANPTYTLSVNPSNNGGNQAEVWLQMTASPMDMAAYYDLNRGQQGIYVTLILTHESGYPDYPGAELRSNMYVGSMFDWLNVDPYRFRQMASPNDTSVSVTGAPPEVFQWTSGVYNGSTECKYAYSDPLGSLNTWGWTSSTQPYGIWQVLPSHEYYDGGPMHRELTEHIGNTLLNMFGGGHYGFGLTQDQPAGNFSSKTFGPAFLYADKYGGSTSDPVSLRSRTLWADAQAQAAAEQGAWPYTWFNPQTPTGMSGSAYPQAGGRGTVSGTMAINDPFNPGASPVSLWVGLAPDDNGTDFQQQYLTYQFWVKTGAGGSFTIPNVLPGTYNLWAFGPGAIGTFKKTNVTVAAGQSLNLGTVTWAPLRLGPTVWEIGTPDRNSNEFHNGEHDVTPYTGVLPAYAGGAPYNTPAQWGAFLAYANQYPNGVSFVVGTSNYAENWNYCQPTTPNGSGGFTGTASKIYFNLPSAPSAAQTARLYLAFAAVYSSACILTINGTVQTASVQGSTDGTYATIANATTGFFPPNHSFDSIIRLGSQGAWGDAYLNFAGNLLKAGTNEIDIGMRASGTAGNGNGFEYDYLRLELTGYATPTPTQGTGATNTFTFTPTPTPTRTNSPANTSTSTATSTATSSMTATPSRTNSATSSATNTPTLTPTNTATSTSTNTATSTVTRTATLTTTNSPMNTSTATSTATPSNTSSATASSTPTRTSSPTATLTSTSSPTGTSTSSATNTLTATSSNTPSATSSSTPTRTPTATNTTVNTPTLSPTNTSVATATRTATSTATSSATQTPTATSTASPTITYTSTLTPTGTAPPTDTPTVTSTKTATSTATDSMTPTASLTATASPSPTRTNTSTNSPTVTASSTATDSMTNTPTSTPSATPSLTASASPSSTRTHTPTLSATASATATTTSSLTATPSSTASRTPTSTATNSATSTATATSSRTPTFTPMPTDTRTVTPTNTRTATPTNTAAATATLSATATNTPTPTLTAFPSFTPTPSGGVQVVAYPNPITGSSFNILITGMKTTDKVQVQIETIAFRVVNQLTFHSEGPGTVNLTIPATDFTGAALADGVYYVVVRTQGVRVILKLLVMR